MKWTKVAQAVHKLKVILDGTIYTGFQTGATPELKYVDNSGGSETSCGVCGNSLNLDNSLNAYFYVDNSTELSA